MAAILAAKTTDFFSKIGKEADSTLSSRPKGVHPQPLSEPYVIVYHHATILATHNR